jgi:hypothetical protein
MAYSEKSATFNVRQIGSIDALMETHTKVANSSVSILEVEATKLEECVFSLLMTQLRYEAALCLPIQQRMCSFGPDSEM